MLFRSSIPNDTWLQGHSFLSTVAKYSNDLPQAEMTARELAYNAPGNQGLRIDYASVLQARGWPRAAENELKKAEVIEPRNINLEVEQASPGSHSPDNPGVRHPREAVLDHFLFLSNA